MSKFNSPRDEVLYGLSLTGWATRSDGDVESPAGWFAIILNLPAELEDLAKNFPELLKEAELEDLDQLLGAFVMTENHDGLVTVTEYDRPHLAWARYKELEAEHTYWDSDIEHMGNFRV